MSKAKRRVFIIIVVVVVVFFVASFAVDRVFLGQTYARYEAQTPNLLLTDADIAADYPSEDVSFELDGYTLRGHVYGAGNTRGFVIFRHGIFSQHQDYLALITAMVDKGWRVFAYDAIGCGISDGDSTLGMSQSPIDVEAAVEYVQQTGLNDGLPIMLWGHSWGGYGVAAALDHVDGVSACVTMSGYDTPMKILEASARATTGAFGATQTPTLWLNTVLAFGSNANRSASKAIASSGVPTLVIHGYGDEMVPYDGVSILMNVAGYGVDVPENVSLITKAESGRNGHADYFYSHNSQAYLNDCSAKLQELLDANDGDATAPEVAEFIADVDKQRANTADPVLIDAIDGFSSQAVS